VTPGCECSVPGPCNLATTAACLAGVNGIALADSLRPLSFPVPAPRDDEALMAAVAAGDVASLGELFERHHRRLYNYFLRTTGNRLLSEDMVQELFVRLLRFRERYRTGGSFAVWLYHLAKNVAIDHFRRNRRYVATDAVPEPTTEPFVLAELEHGENLARLSRAFARLSEDKRELLVLARFEALPYERIAVLLGCTVGAVKVRVHRALASLKDAYRELEGESS
jgi:RNA polymerase sigma factor (sigma-70 family)